MDDCLNEKSGKELARQYCGRANVKLHECYQCGKCTAGCPMAHAMDIMPPGAGPLYAIGNDGGDPGLQVYLAVRLLPHLRGALSPLHRHPVPHGALRQAAQGRGKIGVKTVDMFSSIFMQNVKMFGKSHEVLLEGMYNMTTGRFMQDMDSVPHMLKNKLVGIEPHTTNHPEEIKAIIEKALERGGEEE